MCKQAADDLASNCTVQPAFANPLMHNYIGSAILQMTTRALLSLLHHDHSASQFFFEPSTLQQVANLLLQLYSLVRDHRCCVKATDPDMYITRKFEAMSCRLLVLNAMADVMDPLRRRLIYLSMSAACLQIEGSPKPLLRLICWSSSEALQAHCKLSKARGKGCSSKSSVLLWLCRPSLLSSRQVNSA